VKRLRWAGPERELPKRPIRDSAIAYAVMAAVIVGLGAVTGGSLGRSLVVAVLFYAAAMAWALVRWRRKLREEEGR
jgi:Flp pilus assembly protein TadB